MNTDRDRAEPAAGVLSLGNPRVNAIPDAQCCGKPRGCTMTHDGCAYLTHPWKRAMLFADPTVRCQAATHDGAARQCVLLHGHEEPHQIEGVR